MMRARKGRVVHWAFVLGLLAGCGSVATPRSPTHQAAGALQARGMESFARRQFEQAVGLFSQSLALYHGVEDMHGIARSRINLSQALQAQGKMEQAERVLEPLLLEPHLDYPTSHLADAAFRKASYRLQRADQALSLEWLEHADRYCTATCSVQHKILNLRARIELDQGRPQQALALTERALLASYQRDERGEIANALRLAASAQLALGHARAAVPLLLDALAHDQAAGASDKVFQSLVLLGHAHCAAPAKAKAFWRRARDVAKASEYGAGVEQVDLLMASGDNPPLKENQCKN